MRVGMRRWGKRFTNECRRIDREWTLEWNKRKTYIETSRIVVCCIWHIVSIVGEISVHRPPVCIAN
jgi:hypothetical protein